MTRYACPLAFPLFSAHPIRPRSPSFVAPRKAVNVGIVSWEHTPEWSFTSKLLMSKHQQVQLLEAASVLVAMNQDGPAVAEGAADSGSHPSSDSPAASGSTGSGDGMSSVHTSPPPSAEDDDPFMYMSREHRGQPARRRDSTASTHSRSYQSVLSASTFTDATSPGTPGFHFQGSAATDWRPGMPMHAEQADDDDDAADLAAAVGLLSCSFGTPKTGPLGGADDIPPVPPLPARYVNLPSQDPSKHRASVGQQAIRGHAPSERELRYGNPSWRPIDGEDVAVEDESDYRPSGTKSRSDEDDDSVFGRMEE